MRMKFKVVEQDWYTQFNHPFNLATGGIPFTPQENHDWELEQYKKEGRKYDGPFRYIEECEDMPFPPREGLKYCVRLNEKPTDRYYRHYQCYCWQLGKWWKYKTVEHIFTELYIPQIMTVYDYTNLRCPGKLLSKQAIADLAFYRHYYELQGIRTRASWSVRKMLSECD
jgi:hypothetical protein